MARQRPKSSRLGERDIQVEISGEEGSEPRAFILGGQRHLVAEIVSTWSDESFSGGYRRDAWLGHQRLFYRVRTEAGGLFDIYFDLGERQRRGKGRWVMHRRLAAGAAAAPSPSGEAPAAQKSPKTRRVLRSEATSVAKRKRLPR